MNAMRVFVPATGALLQAWALSGAVQRSGPAHAVTAKLTRWLPSADTEELEYVALTEASESALRLLAADPGAIPRRVVLAVDVELVVAVDNELPPYSEVTAPQRIPMAQVVSVLVDDADAEDAVGVAVEALRAADEATELEQLLDDVAEYELMWFDVCEVPAVLGLVAER